MNAKPARFVGAGGHHASGSRITTDDHRFAAQMPVIALLDRGIESVHINMDDLALFHWVACRGKRLFISIGTFLRE